MFEVFEADGEQSVRFTTEFFLQLRPWWKATSPLCYARMLSIVQGGRICLWQFITLDPAPGSSPDEASEDSNLPITTFLFQPAEIVSRSISQTSQRQEGRIRIYSYCKETGRRISETAVRVSYAESRSPFLRFAITAVLIAFLVATIVLAFLMFIIRINKREYKRTSRLHQDPSYQKPSYCTKQAPTERKPINE
ncbi:MAG: hypothetical protein FWB93_03380 [Oscillospiraceae bacterium]|nr:hypothetical protein [Oscillospiraceae bacterium]